MVKKYLTYINEAKKGKPKFFNLGELLIKNNNITISEKEIEDLVIGEICIWYTKSPFDVLKKQVVSSVEVRNNRTVFFNDFTVDIDKNVEIEGGSKVMEIEDANFVNLHDIVGFPTGEVLYVTREEMQKLLDKGLVRYEKWMKWRERDYRDIYFFKDDDYHKIKTEIDPNYKKSPGGVTGKKNVNFEEKDDYEIGDVIVCQGTAGRLNVSERIGKLIDKVKKPKQDQYDYVVSFMMNFSPYLMDNNTWWIKDENIKGLYTGDIKTQLYLAGLQQNNDYDDDELEEHELDDNYHIRQAFKKKPEPIDAVMPKRVINDYMNYLDGLKADGKIDDQKYQRMLDSIPKSNKDVPININLKEDFS